MVETLKIGGYCTYAEPQKRSVKLRLYWLQFHETETEVQLFYFMKQAETPQFYGMSACSVTGATARMRESELFFFSFLIAWPKNPFPRQAINKNSC